MGIACTFVVGCTNILTHTFFIANLIDFLVFSLYNEDKNFMFESIQNLAFFWGFLLFIIFIPGYFFICAIDSKKNNFFLWERIVFAFVSGIAILNFAMIFLNFLGVKFSFLSIFSIIAIFSLIFLMVFFVRRKKTETKKQKNIFNFNAKEKKLILIILVFVILVKVLYAGNYLVPSSTDLGHHMYWSKQIAQTGEISVYQEREVIEESGNFKIDSPEPISDVIVGEHLVFAAFSIFSGMELSTYFPILILFVINIFSILAFFLLSVRLFAKFPQGKKMAILSLFFIGVLYAVTPPQEKYVVGGVIGNIFGNLFIPIVIYFFFRFFQEKKVFFLNLAIVFSYALAYIHHLSTLLLFFILLSILVFNLVFNLKFSKDVLKSLFRSKSILVLSLSLVLLAGFLFLIYTPAYLENMAVKTVVGGPSKTDHEGLSFEKFQRDTGYSRFLLGLFGILIIIFSWKKRKNIATLFLLGWIFIIAFISFFPSLAAISIPSTRAANYASFPLAILAGFFFWKVFGAREKIINKNVFLVGFFTLLFFLFATGFYSNLGHIENQGENNFSTLSTFSAASFLSQNYNEEKMVLHDHINLKADSWIKLFFMRDYNFPIYRAHLIRYENGDRSEKCTREMISNPLSQFSKRCFQDLNVGYVIVDKIDAGSFNLPEAPFSKIYSNEKVNIYAY